MAAGISDFYRGDTQVYRLTLKDQDGNPIDLTGCTIFFTLKKSSKDPDTNAVIQKKVTSHIDPANGVTEVRLEANETDSLELISYVYDFQLVNSSNEVKTLLSGKVRVLPDITRSIT